MVILEDWRAAAVDVTLDELAVARQICLALCAAAGADDVVDAMEGRVNRPWKTLHHAAAFACLGWVVTVRRRHVRPGAVARRAPRCRRGSLGSIGSARMS